jgi:thiamine pyrophosphokinase
LADFSRLHRKIRLLTDTGEFAAVYSGEPIPCRPGQAISIFNPTTEKIAATSEGLKYPLNGLELNIWWRATLNTALEDHFTLTFNSSAPLLIFLAF